VALDPTRRAELFTTTEFSDVGMYAVRLYKQGDPLTVIVDDRVPIGEDGDLLFAKCNDEAPWAPLIEKAYAKLHGGYSRIAGGREMEAMADLTGYLPMLLDMNAPNIKAKIADGSLCQRLDALIASGGLLGCTATDLQSLPTADSTSGCTAASSTEAPENAINATVALPDGRQGELDFGLREEAEVAALRFLTKYDLEISPEMVGKISAFVAHHQKAAQEHYSTAVNSRKKRSQTTRGVLRNHAYAVMRVEGTDPVTQRLEVRG